MCGSSSLRDALVVDKSGTQVLRYCRSGRRIHDFSGTHANRIVVVVKYRNDVFGDEFLALDILGDVEIMFVPRFKRGAGVVVSVQAFSPQRHEYATSVAVLG